MIIKELKDKHPEIYKRALECMVEQSKKPDEEADIEEFTTFVWGRTKEGLSIWTDVNNGYFAPFYVFHKIPIPNSVIETEFITIPKAEYAELKKAIEILNKIIK